MADDLVSRIVEPTENKRIAIPFMRDSAWIGEKDASKIGGSGGIRRFNINGENLAVIPFGGATEDEIISIVRERCEMRWGVGTLTKLRHSNQYFYQDPPYVEFPEGGGCAIPKHLQPGMETLLKQADRDTDIVDLPKITVMIDEERIALFGNPDVPKPHGVINFKDPSRPAPAVRNDDSWACASCLNRRSFFSPRVSVGMDDYCDQCVKVMVNSGSPPLKDVPWSVGQVRAAVKKADQDLAERMVREGNRIESERQERAEDYRRIRQLRVGNHLLVSLLSQDGRRSMKMTGMPDDAEIVGVMARPEANETAFTVRSKTFDPVPPGGAIPLLIVNVTEIRAGRRTEEDGHPKDIRAAACAAAGNLLSNTGMVVTLRVPVTSPSVVRCAAPGMTYISEATANGAYSRLTDRARKVMQLALQEAQRFNHSEIMPCHVLIGLAKEGSGIAACVLTELGINLRGIREMVEKAFPVTGDQIVVGLPRNSQAVMEVLFKHASEAVDQYKHIYIGTEHLLLACVRGRECDRVLMDVLGQYTIYIEERVRSMLVRELPSGGDDDMGNPANWRGSPEWESAKDASVRPEHQGARRSPSQDGLAVGDDSDSGKYCRVASIEVWTGASGDGDMNNPANWKVIGPRSEAEKPDSSDDSDQPLMVG